MGCVRFPVCTVLSSTPPGSLPGCRRWGWGEAHSTSPLILTHPCHVLAVCPWQITKPFCASASFALHGERLVSVSYLVWVSWSCCHRPSRTGGFQQQECPLSQLRGPEARHLGVCGAMPPPEALGGTLPASSSSSSAHWWPRAGCFLASLPPSSHGFLLSVPLCLLLFGL